MDKNKNKNKKKKQNQKESNKKKPLSLILKILPISLGLLAVAMTIVFLYHSVVKSDYFNIDNTKLILRDGVRTASLNRYNKLSELGKGENIFKLDIASISSKILSDYPEIKNCNVKRRFPNELTINIFMRQAIAQIDLGKFYLIDEEAFLLSKARSEATKKLTIITGIGGWAPRKIGDKFRSSKVLRAIKLITAIRTSGLLRRHTLGNVDASDSKNLSFFIDEGLQIKIGRDHFDDRIKLLKETLLSSYVDKDDLEYIDLRFDDIIFGTK